MAAVSPSLRRALISPGGPGGSRGLARWAVGLGSAVVAVLAVSYAIFGVAWAFGGEDAVSDNVVGILAGVALVAGMLASLVAFAMALVAGVTHQRWVSLWLPLSLFPALLAVVTLVEVLWIE